MASKPADNKPKRPRLRLPFDNRREDAGEWVFDHRAGLCITVIVYLVLAIVFVSSRIIIGRQHAMQGMVIDIETLEELAAERDRLAEEVRERQMQDYDLSEVRNLTSNENADASDYERALRNAAGSELSETGREVQERIAANREAFERGVREAEAIAERREQGGGEDAPVKDGKVAGNVTVSYSLDNPLRYRRKLPVPAYTCEGGGRVVVDITVDRSGEVTAATVDRSQSSPDEGLHEAALSAARRSRFDLNQSAPERHKGTITYIFLPQ